MVHFGATLHSSTQSANLGMSPTFGQLCRKREIIKRHAFAPPENTYLDWHWHFKRSGVGGVSHYQRVKNMHEAVGPFLS